MNILKLKQAAEQGDADAQNQLARAYHFGKGVPIDQAEAVKWLRKAAEQHHLIAELFLGFAYYKGEGIAQDYMEAAKWYAKSAEQGNADAQFCLGCCYLDGEGVPKDNVLAYMWINLAGESYDVARKKRDGIAAQMTPEQIAEAQKRCRDWKPRKRK
jgi:uncharacterized protein